MTSPIPAAMPRATKEIVKAQKGTYEIVKLVGVGTFGAVYKVKRESDNKYFAMKCESLKIKISILRQASSVHSAFTIKSPHFLDIEERGTVMNRFLFIMMPLLGKNLVDLKEECGLTKRYSLSSALCIAEQTLAAVRDVHRNGFIHRDIKPTHFCIGLESDNLHHTVFILDFGICKRPRSDGKKGPEDEEEAKLRKGAIHYRGVVRFASIRGHHGKELGYRDDMESWWYMTLEMILGSLPWTSLPKSAEAEVILLKQNIQKEPTLAKLCKMVPVSHSMIEMLTSLNTIKQPNELCDYDAVFVCIDEIFRKMKLNRLAPPDWDCLTDYMGPNYQTGLVDKKASAGAADTAFPMAPEQFVQQGKVTAEKENNSILGAIPDGDGEAAKEKEVQQPSSAGPMALSPVEKNEPKMISPRRSPSRDNRDGSRRSMRSINHRKKKK